MRYTTALILGAFLAVPAVAGAQALPNTGYEVTILRRGTTTVVSTTVIPAAQVQCGLTPSTPISTLIANPNQIKFLAADGLECVYTDPGNGPLRSLPVSAQEYDARVAGINPAGTGDPSASSNPFWLPGSRPATPTRVIVGRSS